MTARSIRVIQPRVFFSIDIANNAPSAPTGSLPANGAVVNDLNPVLVINNSSDADGDELTYNFQVATDSGFFKYSIGDAFLYRRRAAPQPPGQSVPRSATAAPITGEPGPMTARIIPDGHPPGYSV